MSRPRCRRPTVLLASLAAAAAVTTGCGAGFDATALQSYAPADGVQGSSGQMRVLNALVVAPGEGSAGSAGVVIMAVVNGSSVDEEITSVETDAGSVDYTGSTTIQAGGTVTFGAGSDPAAVVDGLSAEPGEEITVKVSFAEAEPISLRTVVVSATGDYESVTLAPEPSPSTSLSPAPSPSPS